MLTDDARRELVLQLTRDVTQTPEPPYEELERSLEELIDLISGKPRPAKHMDWPAVLCEAINLRPRGH